MALQNCVNLAFDVEDCVFLRAVTQLRRGSSDTILS